MGFAIPAWIHLRRRSRPEGPVVIRLFWLGVGVGLTWEAPIFLSMMLSDDPIAGFLREPPLPPFVFLVAHGFWDGGLFLLGLALVGALCADPVLARFRWAELAVFVTWGQVSALAVEVASLRNGGWFYREGIDWNPLLFRVDGHAVTALPQLIWLAAPVAYYLLALRMVRRARSA